MKVKKLHIVAALAVLLLAVGMAAPVLAGQMTITGEVNDANQIVTSSGDVYEVLESEKGAELVANIGKTVEVQGMVEESDGLKTIDVASFKIIEP